MSKLRRTRAKEKRSVSADVGRFERFTDQEQALLSLALSLWTIEMFYGVLAGPLSAEVQARDMPVLERLINELCGASGLEPCDPDLMAAAIAQLDQNAAEERDRA